MTILSQSSTKTFIDPPPSLKTNPTQKLQNAERASPTTTTRNDKKVRILHVVTSSHEYDTGYRATTRGSDRLQGTILPLINRFLSTSLSRHPDWSIDVYLILGYETERKDLIAESLPDGVGLEIWEDATPIYYPPRENRLVLATHGLARQHRFVVKDKFDEYDFFSCWEDDMQITSYHIENFLEISTEIDRLIQLAPEKSPSNSPNTLTRTQLLRLIPGFIRVEVTPPKFAKKKQPIIADQSVVIDPEPCCGNDTAQSETVGLWETAIKGFGVREFEGLLGWVSLMPSIVKRKEDVVNMYWSGEDGAFGNEKHPGRHPQYMAQQGGWMATKSQILNFDKVCPGGFLPPFVDSFWHNNAGLKPQNVEFWSGGYQLFGRCYLQRIIPLDKDRFSRQLLYHKSNNKQGQLGSGRFTTADVLIGQLYTVRDNAIRARGKKKH